MTPRDSADDSIFKSSGVPGKSPAIGPPGIKSPGIKASDPGIGFPGIDALETKTPDIDSPSLSPPKTNYKVKSRQTPLLLESSHLTPNHQV